ncbi:MAG: HEAT repeat domain-containing protein [Prochloraceae cyanobacterium]
MFYSLVLILAATGFNYGEFSAKYSNKSIDRVLARQNIIVSNPEIELRGKDNYRVKQGVIIVVPDWLVLLLLISILLVFLFWIVRKNIEFESNIKTELKAKQNLENNPDYLNKNRSSLIQEDPDPIHFLAKIDPIAESIENLNRSQTKERAKIIWELAQRSDSTAIEPLLKLAIEADPWERSLILTAIANIVTRALKPIDRALQISLEDRNSQVGKNAIGEVKKVYELILAMTRELSYLRDDRDREVRDSLVRSLKQLNKLQSYKNLSQEESDNNRMSRKNEFDV